MPAISSPKIVVINVTNIELVNALKKLPSRVSVFQLFVKSEILIPDSKFPLRILTEEQNEATKINIYGMSDNAQAIITNT